MEVKIGPGISKKFVLHRGDKPEEILLDFEEKISLSQDAKKVFQKLLETAIERSFGEKNKKE